MLSWFVTASESLLLIVVALVVSWAARTAIRVLTRRAVRRAQRAQRTSWRMRLDRLGDDGQSDARRRQRADAVARLLGHLVTVAVFAVATLVALHLLGVDPVVAISSAGFLGLALALSAQDFVKDFLAGMRVLLEDRYAVGDDVTMTVGGTDVSGTVDLIGAASVRLRTTDGATWHAGHHAIDTVTNFSQLPAVTGIEVPATEWIEADPTSAPDRLVESSNDVGLTGVVFVRDIEAHGAGGDQAESDTSTGVVTVAVKTNRPLSDSQTDIVRDRLLGR